MWRPLLIALHYTKIQKISCNPIYYCIYFYVSIFQMDWLAFQKESFWVSKGVLLGCKRGPF